jgi:hypothetical protein
MSQDPPRLFEGNPSSDLARALRAARADVLSTDAVARVRTGVVTASAVAAASPIALKSAGSAPVSAPAATPAAPGLPVAKGASFGLFAKASAVVIVVGVGLGIYGLSRTSVTPSNQPAHTVVLPARDPAPPVAAPAVIEREPSPVAVPVVAEPTKDVAPEIATKPAPKNVVRPAPQPSGISHGEGDAVTREGAMLLEARRMLDSDPAKALALVKKCETDFPDSQLAPERARIAAQAKQRLAP